MKKYSALAWIFIFVGIGMIASFSHPNFYPSNFLEVIISNHNAFIAISSDNNLIHFYNLSPDWKNIFINAPWALLSGLFRPMAGEGRGILGLAASVENFFLLLFFVSSLVNLKKAISSPHRMILLAVISYCIVQCIFLALSTPNMGSCIPLSRWLPAFFCLCWLVYGNPVMNWLFNRITFNRSLSSIGIFGP